MVATDTDYESIAPATDQLFAEIGIDIHAVRLFTHTSPTYRCYASRHCLPLPARPRRNLKGPCSGRRVCFTDRLLA